MKEMWDQRYSEQEFVYGKGPNLFFKSFIDTHQPGRILLPGEGEGRNALYAASKGWEVHAVDFSKVARQKALQRAKEANLHIRYDEADLAKWDGNGTFDYVGLIYAHFPEAFRQSLHRKFCEILSPGGQIFMEAFSQDQIHYNSGGPKDINMLYSIDMLKHDFQELIIEYLNKQIREMNESQYHEGKASIIRFIGQKEIES